LELPTINTPIPDAQADASAAETAAAAKRAPAKQSPVKQSLHYRLVITIYRVFAITVLYLVLASTSGRSSSPASRRLKI
jgi:hypothetical protein